ncbi:MAG: bifunctional glycosyltransferase family 2/GtrA family protein [Desulfobacterales bacterium]|nr:bifunctional glycosyltransferase family 2/GtrA family protein [Desulfobacterales bacterium]
MKLSIVIPCYNEAQTLEKCLKRVIDIKNDNMLLEIIIVDDCSTDNSFQIAKNLSNKYPEILIFRHEQNQGKGAALRTGIQNATGDYVVIQDADLEYNPNDLKKLLTPLIENEADVVLGSRFLTGEPHRVLYFWHYMGNKFLTLLSNMFSDLNLTDMECCYKMFRRDIIEKIKMEENRFGIEPELVAKIAKLRPRIFEVGISYTGRTYEEGKKIGVKDGFRALYCIFHYNLPHAPLILQFLVYTLIELSSTFLNASIFIFLDLIGLNINLNIPLSYLFTGIFNYFICIAILFRHKIKWSTQNEIIIYSFVILIGLIVDFGITKILIAYNYDLYSSKGLSYFSGLFFNFWLRRYLVFPSIAVGPWKAQVHK